MKGKGLICSRKTRRGCLIFLPFQAPFANLSSGEKTEGKREGEERLSKASRYFSKAQSCYGEKKIKHIVQ